MVDGLFVEGCTPEESPSSCPENQKLRREKWLKGQVDHNVNEFSKVSPSLSMKHSLKGDPGEDSGIFQISDDSSGLVKDDNDTTEVSHVGKKYPLNKQLNKQNTYYLIGSFFLYLFFYTYHSVVMYQWYISIHGCPTPRYFVQIDPYIILNLNAKE